MSKLNDRSFMAMDGTYVNVPDYHSLQPSKKIGLREFNKSILVHNWFEERTPPLKRDFKSSSSYTLDYNPYPGAKPDVVVRRKMIGASGGVGSKHLIGMHDFDSSKNMITLYDETINRRARPGPEMPTGQQFPERREWKIINDAWVPEKVDHPLQGEPTKWGLVEKKRNEAVREQDKYVKQLSNVSEYAENYQRYSNSNYSQRVTSSVPKEISSSFYDTNKKLNQTPMARSTIGAMRLPQARDVMDTVYSNMLVKSEKAPRTFYYLGKIPTNGALDVYSMKDFETLTSRNQPLQNFNTNELNNNNNTNLDMLNNF